VTGAEPGAVGGEPGAADPPPSRRRVPLGTVAAQWGRIGVTGFGGPPTHIALLRRLVVDERRWVSAEEVEAAIAACNLLPGPASTQLSIYLARAVAGPSGAVIGGLCFVVPAVVAVIALSVVFLAHTPPHWIRGAGEGAGAAVAAVAVSAGVGLLRPSWKRARASTRRRVAWVVYAALGAVAAALVGRYLVLVLLACGFVELAARARGRLWSVIPLAVAAPGGVPQLVWVAFKVGALSYGGGFVIIPLMQSDAVHTYHWMTSSQFLSAVALGQVTPGPVVATVAAIGYAAHGVGGGVLAAAIAFLPSFLIVLVGGGRFQRLRTDWRAQAFLDGAGPAALGAILGAAIPLAGALREPWQIPVLAAAAVALLVVRRGIVEVLVAAGVVGAVVALLGAPV
jgi:chromate transporter